MCGCVYTYDLNSQAPTIAIECSQLSSTASTVEYARCDGSGGELSRRNGMEWNGMDSINGSLVVQTSHCEYSQWAN